MSDGPTNEEKIAHLQERMAKLENIIEQALHLLHLDDGVDDRTSRQMYDLYMEV